MSAFERIVDELRDEFVTSELGAWRVVDGDRPERAPVHVSAVGTLAPSAVKSPALLAAAASAGVELDVGTPHTMMDDLLADDSWNLAIVLSPSKRDAAHRVADLTPAAAATDVVDTIVRRPTGLLGVNTNVYGAGAAITRCVVPARIDRVAILGTGASARSVAVACNRWLPDAELTLIGRSPERTAEAAGALRLAVGTPESGADVVVNTTSWGETDASEDTPPGFDLDPLLAPGTVVFDINNRVSALKRMALERGCVVVPGTLMQRLVNALRVTLARRVAGG